MSSPTHPSSFCVARAQPVPGYWTTDIVDAKCFECASCGVSIEPSSEIYLAFDAKFCSQLCRSMTLHQQQAKDRQNERAPPRKPVAEKAVRSGFAFLGF